MTADTIPQIGPAVVPDPAQHIRRVVLDGDAPPRLSALQEADRAQAVADLEAENSFDPSGLRGPFVLHLSLHDGRLVLDVRDAADAPLLTRGLALGPFRRIIKDYQLLVESYELAAQEGREARIQAIDMGRRGLHDEGAELLMQRLDSRIRIDHATARRLFTLVCALHQRLNEHA